MDAGLRRHDDVGASVRHLSTGWYKFALITAFVHPLCALCRPSILRPKSGGQPSCCTANRILTTHTGSLPRPPALTELYARRAAGETVDEAAIDAAGKAATRHVVRKQIAAGIDVGNNGEHMREAFFLYVRHRMSGFGGSWNRRADGGRAALSRVPRLGAAADGDRPSVSNRDGMPKAIGAVHYIDLAASRRNATNSGHAG